MPDDITNGLELVIDRIDENGAVSIEGRWFREAHAQALLDVAEAADTLMRTGRGRSERGRVPLLRALSRLDAARKS